MQDRTTLRAGEPWAANLIGLDYEKEAAHLGAPPVPIIDVHLHVNGRRAGAVFKRVCDLYGIDRIYTQTRIEEAAGVREVFGDRVRFLAIPDYAAEDKSAAMREGFLHNLRRFHDEFGARMVKLWSAPRLRDLVDEGDDLYRLDSAWRVRVAEAAVEMGMMIMTHIADPDTWFATKYADTRRYGTKREQYEPLEVMLERFPVPWIAAHMGGWPEDLSFLDDLLARHDNLYLDTSATKWMVRELSRHPRDDLVRFFARWEGRILFGSDIVTNDAHLEPAPQDAAKDGARQAQSEHEAFELYASRYWALRTLFETDYEGASPIADPDLMMVEPQTYDELSSPGLSGKVLPRELLISLYRGAAETLLERWWEEHP